MKRQSEEEKFISELLANDGELSRSTLAHGLAVARRKRARRSAWRAAGLSAPLVILAVIFAFTHRGGRGTMNDLKVQGPRLTGGSTAAPRVIEGASVHILSDAELLDFFTNRPVALVGPPGKQTLILFDEGKN